MSDLTSPHANPDFIYANVAQLLVRAMLSSPSMDECAEIHVLLVHNDELLRDFHRILSSESALVSAHKTDHPNDRNAQAVADELKFNGIAVFADTTDLVEAKSHGLALHDEYIAALQKQQQKDSHDI